MTQQDTQPPAETLDDREAVARIINPSAWPSEEQATAYPDEDWDAAKRAAFAKTDAIHAALTRRAGVTLYREIDALGGTGEGLEWQGYREALTDVLKILNKHGFRE